MSAFICDQYHIGAMASHLVRHRRAALKADGLIEPQHGARDMIVAERVAAALAHQNVVSVAHRYERTLDDCFE